MSGNKAKDGEIMQRVLQLLAERDESIRGAFAGISQEFRNAVGNLDLKIAVIATALGEAGIPESRLMEIAKDIQNKMVNNSKEQEGNTNEPYNREPSSEGGEVVRESIQPSSEEGGSERFRRS